LETQPRRLRYTDQPFLRPFQNRVNTGKPFLPEKYRPPRLVRLAGHYWTCDSHDPKADEWLCVEAETFYYLLAGFQPPSPIKNFNSTPLHCCHLKNLKERAVNINQSTSTIVPSSKDLTISDKVLTATPPTATTEAMKEAARKWREANPDSDGVIYHPSNPSPSQPTEPGQVIDAVITWIGSTSPTANFPAAESRLIAANDSLKTNYMQFLDDLKNIDPALEEQDFGFTVDPQGNLKATSLSGSINADDLARLTDYMNRSDSLKDAANEFVQSSFDYVKEDKEYQGTGGFVLNMNNFEKTVDLGQMYTYQKSGKSNMGNFFAQQVMTKGERAPHPF